MHLLRPGLSRAAILLTTLVFSACAPQPVTPPTPSAPPPPPSPSAPPSPTAPAPTPTAPPAPTLTPDTRPAIDTPAWFDNAVIYEIFPRSFRDSNGDGIGDLRGIIEQLDYIQSLGVDTLWLTPHYPSNTYHGYAVADYTAVNPDFGTLDDFKALSAALKQRNMKLIVDFVANHASNAHPYFVDAYKNPASRYSTWFNFTDDSNSTYTSFFGVRELPDWNTGNPDVVKYLQDAALFWLDLGADGLRCDYALGVDFPFWRDLRATVKAKHPEAVLLAEVFDGNPLKIKPYFENGFDAAFDFPFFYAASGAVDGVQDGLLAGKGDPRSMQSPYRLLQRQYPPGAQLVRFASNHDTNRIASEVAGGAAQMRLAAALTLLTPGVPMIYYGEEIGMRGVKGPGPIYDEYRREPLDWYAGESGPGMTTWFKPANRSNKAADGVSVEEQTGAADSLLNAYRALGELRRAHPALRSRDFQVIDKPAGCPACLAMWRWTDGELALVAFNLSDQAADLSMPGQAPVAATGASVSPSGYSGGDKHALPAWGWLLITWPAR